LVFFAKYYKRRAYFTLKEQNTLKLHIVIDFSIMKLFHGCIVLNHQSIKTTIMKKINTTRGFIPSNSPETGSSTINIVKRIFFKSRLFTLLFCLATMLQLQSCKKDVPADEKTYTVSFSKHALEYVNLTEGKYFIYKDSATSQLDSVIVTKSKLEVVLYEPISFLSLISPARNYHDEFKLTLTKFSGPIQTDWLVGIAAAKIDDPPVSTNTAWLGLTSSDSLYMFFSFSENEMPNDSITVEGRTYHNVVVTKWQNGFEETSPYFEKMTTYWAKDLGVIRREINTINEAVKTYTLVRNG
jgi:hypothetical protein